MSEYHLIDGRLPPFPEKLKKVTRISREEEEKMCVELELTDEYRTKFDFANTSNIEEDLEIIDTVLNQTAIGSVEHGGRKRGFSFLSQSSGSTSRHPLLSKLVHR